MYTLNALWIFFYSASSRQTCSSSIVYIFYIYTRIDNIKIYIYGVSLIWQNALGVYTCSNYCIRGSLYFKKVTLHYELSIIMNFGWTNNALNISYVKHALSKSVQEQSKLFQWWEILMFPWIKDKQAVLMTSSSNRGDSSVG